jgi:hypothetical protein
VDSKPDEVSESISEGMGEEGEEKKKLEGK